uniref:uncharacterized protein LOC132675465 n=1 Tax=Panthera onca TaxID=9690 RepID=UPI0029533A1C
MLTHSACFVFLSAAEGPWEPRKPEGPSGGPGPSLALTLKLSLWRKLGTCSRHPRARRQDFWDLGRNCVELGQPYPGRTMGRQRKRGTVIPHEQILRPRHKRRPKSGKRRKMKRKTMKADMEELKKEVFMVTAPSPPAAPALSPQISAPISQSPGPQPSAPRPQISALSPQPSAPKPQPHSPQPSAPRSQGDLSSQPSAPKPQPHSPQPSAPRSQGDLSSQPSAPKPQPHSPQPSAP